MHKNGDLNVWMFLGPWFGVDNTVAFWMSVVLVGLAGVWTSLKSAFLLQAISAIYFKNRDTVFEYGVITMSKRRGETVCIRTVDYADALE